MAQFLGGGLSFDGDADATECLLLLELANESTFPVFLWRSRRRPRQRQSPSSGDGGGVQGDGRGPGSASSSAETGFGAGEVVEIPGESRRCLSLRIPRLRVSPEVKVRMPVGTGCTGSSVSERPKRYAGALPLAVAWLQAVFPVRGFSAIKVLEFFR